MSSVAPIRLAAVVATLILLVASTASARKPRSKKSESPALPLPRVTLTLRAAQSPSDWTMLLINRGDVPLRVVADARELRLMVRRAGKRGYLHCTIPKAMRGKPRNRQLVLAPGARYEERFDPRLFCWGKDLEKFNRAASVTGFLGWKPDARRARRKKPQRPPFIVEPVLAPPAVQPRKQVASLTAWPQPKRNPKGDKKSSKKGSSSKPTISTVGAPHLSLSTPRFSDAHSHRNASVSTKVKNVGDRDAVVHLRRENFEFYILRPDGKSVVCGPPAGRRAVVRDFFHTVRPGRSENFTVILAEVCPPHTFDRPGLYEVRAVLNARETGTEFGLRALTGSFRAPRATLLRVRSARKRYHRSAPLAVK